MKFYLYLFSFTLGLSFTHHMQTIYLVPASIFFIIAVWWKHKNSKLLTLNSIFKIGILFILPLFLYLYLPIRASINPKYWIGDPDTIEKFINYITFYRNYVSIDLNNLIQKGVNHLKNFLPHQFTSYFLWFCPIGILILLIKKWNVFSFFILIGITNILVSAGYTISNIEDYYLPFFTLFSILTGWSIYKIIRVVILILRKMNIHEGIVYTYSSISFILLPLFLFNINYRYNNCTNYYFDYDYGRNSIFPLIEDSMAFVYGDYMFTCAYLQLLENWKSNVIFINVFYLPIDWYANHLKEIHKDLNFELYPKKRL